MYRRFTALCILVLLLSACSSETATPDHPAGRPVTTTAIVPAQSNSGVVIPGQNGTPASPAQTTKISEEQLYIRYGANTADDQLLIMKIPSGQTERKFPAGVISADWSILYSAAINGERTTVTGFYLSSGTAFRTNTFNGRFALPQIDGGTRFGGLSPDGKTLVMEERLTDQQIKAANVQKHWVSRFAVLDTSLQSPARFIELEGSFAYDALSPDGKKLYLIEHLAPYDGGHYQVRLYDLALDKLNPDPVFDKGEAPVMEGYSGSQVASPKGNWVYTIYRNSQHGPFVHALDTQDGVAVCLDLPIAGKENEVAALRWSLAMSNHGATLYVVNPVLGQITAINPDWPQVQRSVNFAPQTLARQRPTAGTSSNVLSLNGLSLFVLGGNGIMAIDTLNMKMRQQIALSGVFDSLALSKDGRQLYATSAERRKMVVLDPDSGATIAELPAGDQPGILLKADVRP